MSAAWVVVLVVGATTVLIKGAGPVLLGRRELSPRVLDLVEVLAPVMLAALVVTQAFGGHGRLVFDARLTGIGAAVLALSVRAPLVVVLVVAGAVAGVTRLLL